MDAFETVDIASEAFALRLANLLVATRTRNGLGVAAVARASEGTFSRNDLKAYERGGRTLDEQTVDELAQLYRCDLGVILPLRLPVAVTADMVSAGGVEESIDGTGPEATLIAYLTLVRSLRRQRKAPTVDIRRDDVDVLAGYLGEPPETVVHQLATLMNATQAKRTALVAVLATGAVVVGLVGTAVAIGGSDTTTPATPVSDTSIVVDTTVASPVSTVPAPVTTISATVSSTTTTAPVAPTTAAPSTTESVQRTSPVTTVRPAAVPTTAVAPTTTFPLVDTDLTTTTTIVAIDGPPIPP